MKAKLRKTGEICDIICYGGQPKYRSEAIDYVSYIDSKGVEHSGDNHLNYYWDFEPIEEQQPIKFPDLRAQIATGVMEVLIRIETGKYVSINNKPCTHYEGIANAAIAYADALIKELEK